MAFCIAYLPFFMCVDYWYARAPGGACKIFVDCQKKEKYYFANNKTYISSKNYVSLQISHFKTTGGPIIVRVLAKKVKK